MSLCQTIDFVILFPCLVWNSEGLLTGGCVELLLGECCAVTMWSWWPIAWLTVWIHYFLGELLHPTSLQLTVLRTCLWFSVLPFRTSLLLWNVWEQGLLQTTQEPQKRSGWLLLVILGQKLAWAMWLEWTSAVCPCLVLVQPAWTSFLPWMSRLVVWWVSLRTGCCKMTWHGQQSLVIALTLNLTTTLCWMIGPIIFSFFNFCLIGGFFLSAMVAKVGWALSQFQRRTR